MQMSCAERESSPIAGELHVHGAGGNRTLTDSRPADLKSSRLAQEPTTIGGMDIRLGLLYVVYLLSILPLDPLESPGVGRASFV